MSLNVGELLSHPGEGSLDTNSVSHGSIRLHNRVGKNERDSGLVLSKIGGILPFFDLIIDILSLFVKRLDFSIEGGISLRVVMSLSDCGDKSEGWNSGEFGKHLSNF